MESAFQHYSKKKPKNIKIKLKHSKKKSNGFTASTPMPQMQSSLFPVDPESLSPVENAYLSPVPNKKPKKSSKKVEDSDLEAVKVKKAKKEKNRKHLLNGLAEKSTEEVLSVDSEELFNKNPFKSKKQKRKRSITEDDEKEEQAEKVGGKKKRKINDISDSLKEGKKMLAWILSPLDVDDFFENYWEKKPLYIARNNKSYFDGICGVDDLDSAYRRCPMYFLKNVTVTSYQNGERSTDNTPGRVRSNTVSDLLAKGNSVRVLNPQTFVPNVGSIVSTLQEYFRCMVGVNSYLTPPGTQGFAPHYDDIEAFVLQMEGQKEWKVYPPRSKAETLPRFSSPDFQQSEIGEPMMEVTLKAGDLLYFPRGFIHQARSVESHHSLHLTVSSYQCNSWGDYFKAVLPLALEQAIANEVDLRKGLPLDFIDHMGIASEGSDKSQRTSMISQAQELFYKILKHCPWDEAADQLGKEFIHSSFPPRHEELDKETWDKLFENPSPNTAVKLITANACRITAVDDQLVVYYSTDNSLEPRGEELLGFEISPEEAAVLEKLRNAYPYFCKLKYLAPSDDDESKTVVTDLLFNLAQRALLKVKDDEKVK